MKVKIHSIMFSGDMKRCAIQVLASELGLDYKHAVASSGKLVCEHWLPVKRGRLPPKKEIEAAVRAIVRKRDRLMAEDDRRRRLFDEARSYEGKEIEV